MIYDMTEETEEGSLEFILCPKCYCKLTFEDWMEHGCPNCEKKRFQEINYIKYTLEHYSGDINDLEWSTLQIKSLLSSVEKVQKERDDFKQLYEVERETCNRWIDKHEKLEEKVKELEILLSEAGK